MKKLILMFVMLITGIANAQDTFNFRCIPAEELAIAAIYEANTPPTEFNDALNSASVIANGLSGTTFNQSRRDFVSLFDKYGLTFNTFVGNPLAANYDNTDFDDIPFPTGNGTVDENAAWNIWMLEIAKAIWLYGHDDYDPAAAAFVNALESIYAYEHPPTELGTIINDAALAVEFGIAGNTPRKNFMESLAYFNVTVSGVFDSNSKPSEAHLSNGNVVPNIGTNANTSSMNPAQFAVFAFEVVKRFWHIGHPTYAADQAKAQLRAERTETVKMLGNDDVEVRVSLDTVEGNIIGVSDTDGEQYIYVQLYDLSNQTGFVGLEDLQEGEFTLLKNAITAKVNELTPTVAKELATIFSSDTAPVGSAPEWLPTALYAKANTLTSGTHRLDYISNGLLSAHGVTITRGGLGQTGATVTTFILSKGDGYDVTFDWGAYSSEGFHNDNASPELYRNLVFDVIKAGWKLINETNNTKRSDMLDQDLDVTGNNVELITEGPPNYDWWIYFNVDGVQIPILSGGVNGDPMFYNKYTVNPHDPYMTEVEFQRLVVFVTYMRNNFEILRSTGVSTEEEANRFTRKTAITHLAQDFGGTVSFVESADGGDHATFTRNGETSNVVQSNWTHPAWVNLGHLSPNNWVKYYAKCRGILIGLGE